MPQTSGEPQRGCGTAAGALPVVPVLSLATPTDPAWVERVLADLDELLVDHAHCEKKAASTVVSLLFRYADRPALVAALSPLAREELEHFELVLAHLAARGVAFRHQVPAPYAAALLKAVRPEEPARLLDTLLCLALIEARSCERMRLLADTARDPAIADLYRGLLASEARHHRTYVDLAATVAATDVVRDRLRQLAAHEAAVLASAPAMPRMHA
ncbi:MAG: tRNA-(ms[2]io[6]A)-hydroxylase [Candidatus Binatia bacterium]